MNRPVAWKLLADPERGPTALKVLLRRARAVLRCRRGHLWAFAVDTPHGVLLAWHEPRRWDAAGMTPWRAEWGDQLDRWTALVVGCSCYKAHQTRGGKPGLGEDLSDDDRAWLLTGQGTRKVR